MPLIEPNLDIITLDTHNTYLLAIADVTNWPTGFTISTPTIQITPPGYPMVSLAFTAKSVQVYNSATLGITCSDDNCPTIPLPDGMWKVVYSVAPSYKYYVEKNFLVIKKFLEKYDEIWLKLDLFECDGAVKSQDKKTLETVEEYIKGAIAAANNCYTKMAMDLYNKALTLLKNYSDKRCLSQNKC